MSSSIGRVAMVAPKLPASGNPTGSPAHILKTRRALQDRGVDVELLELEFWPDSGGKTHYARAFRRLFADGIHQIRRRPAVLHCHGETAVAATAPFARAAGIPIVCEIHGIYTASQRGDPGARPFLSRWGARLEGWALRRADHVIAQAHSMKLRLCDRFRIPGDRITTIYPGVNVAEFTGQRVPAAVPGAACGEKLVMYAGSTHKYQGLDLLARAQALLNNRRQGVRLVLVISSDSGAQEDVVARFGFDGAATTVVHLGDSAELPAWLARADAIVHARPDCPDSLNVQSKLGLCLAAGKPFVTTATGDYPLLLGESRGCLLAAPEPEALACAMAEAVGNPDVSFAARESNPALARQYFDVSRNIDSLLRVYEAVATA